MDSCRISFVELMIYFERKNFVFESLKFLFEGVCNHIQIFYLLSELQKKIRKYFLMIFLPKVDLECLFIFKKGRKALFYIARYLII